VINREQSGPRDDNRLSHDAWERAYLRFETPEQEVRKFIGRLKFVGAMKWPRNARIVELCCGRGTGLTALHRLGFSELEGIDLSPSLAAEYAGPGKILVADCRHLPFKDASKDILIVQGGLHHLPVLPDDLDQALNEGGARAQSQGIASRGRTMGYALSLCEPCALSKPAGPRVITKDRCATDHDSLRTKNLQTMADPAATCPGFTAEEFSLRAVLFQIGEDIFYWT